MLVRDLILDILEAVVGGRPEVEEGLLDDADHVGGRLQVRRVGLQPVLELLYRLAPVSWLGGRICNSEQLAAGSGLDSVVITKRDVREKGARRKTNK